ncbi:MAG: PLP-dependent aminotransferase family protein [Gemmatimonadaceae bacterium]|nr:PLP-dependent aminotransferase family protein [Gloeobacterales cyanobacterium ES-bin-141]
MQLAIHLDSTSTVPLHRQLYEQLRQRILSGQLLPGQRLPSTRILAELLAISRTTASLGYEHLLSEGYLQAHRGSGTCVCTQLPEQLLQAASPIVSVPSIGGSPRLSRYGAGLSEARMLLGKVSPPPSINFRYGPPAFDALPLQQWRRLLTRHCRCSPGVLDYATDPLGYHPLRESIARYLTRSRAVRCTADQMLIVSGSQQALDLTTRLLVDPSDVVALEDPGYLGARHAFLAQGAILLGLPVDSEGMVMEQLTGQPPGTVKLVYVTPSHQFPTGSVLSLPRRLELLAWAKASNALVVEDDYDSEYRYGGRPIPALQGLDRGDSVIYVGTFSKVLFPSLRLGYLVVPLELMPVFARARWLTDRHSPLLEQYVLRDFIEEGFLERHIRRMRRLYAERRQVLVETLHAHLGNRASVLGEEAGMHVLVRFQTHLSDEALVARAAEAGVGLTSAAANYLHSDVQGEFILGYADLTPERLVEGVVRIARILDAKE